EQFGVRMSGGDEVRGVGGEKGVEGSADEDVGSSARGEHVGSVGGVNVPAGEEVFSVGERDDLAASIHHLLLEQVGLRFGNGRGRVSAHRASLATRGPGMPGPYDSCLHLGRRAGRDTIVSFGPTPMKRFFLFLVACSSFAAAPPAADLA